MRFQLLTFNFRLATLFQLASPFRLATPFRAPSRLALLPLPLRRCDELNLPYAVAPLLGARTLTNACAAEAKKAASTLTKTALVLFALLIAGVIANAQGLASKAGDEIVVEGGGASDVFGMGRGVRVRGQVKDGALAFGGDVIVEGRIEGDVAAIGGSVIQLKGSYVGGDVIVIGGEYRHEEGAEHNPAGRTVMIAGYEQQLREIAQNPASLLTPELSLAFVGWRVLAILFWFVVSIALTAVSPGAVGRAAARLQLTFTRVALIGLLGALVLGPGFVASLKYFPPALSAVISITSLLFILLSYIFGRVAINAATGRWLQRVLLPEEKRSESVALLLGAAFWALVLAVPYVWLFLVVGLFVMSLGLALTARYSLIWRRV
jgi:hypothetical protein